MCEDCGGEHKKNKQFTSHTLVSIEGILCSTHDTIVTHYCQECKILVCNLHVSAFSSCVEYHGNTSPLRGIDAKQELNNLITEIEDATEKHCN